MSNRSPFEVHYKDPTGQFILFVGLIAYFVAATALFEFVFVLFFPEWFLEEGVDVSRRSNDKVPFAAIPLALILVPAYLLIQKIRGKKMDKAAQGAGLNGESLMLTMFGLAVIYGIIILIVKF